PGPRLGGTALNRRALMIGGGIAAGSALLSANAAWANRASASAVQAEPTAPPTTVVNEGADKQISMWINWSGQGPVEGVQKTLEAFIQESPDVSVQLTPGADPATKLVPAIAAGNPPDVAHLRHFAVAMAARNAL